MTESARTAHKVPLLASLRIIFLSSLTIMGLVGCGGEQPDSVTIQFQMNTADVARGVGEVRDLRFYVHDVELMDESGKLHPFAFDASVPWQSAEVALIDLVGEAHADLNTELRGSVQGAPFSGIRFTIGVPFGLNHMNPLTAAPPLDRGDLFWSWQSGYKFLRADLADQDREWSFHLGSTGCVSSSAVRAPDRPCSQPNLMRIELSGFDPTKAPIRVRVDEMFKSMDAPNASTCTGGYQHDPGCADIYAKTGLGAADGQCANGCRDQRLFSSGADSPR